MKKKKHDKMGPDKWKADEKKAAGGKGKMSKSGKPKSRY